MKAVELARLVYETRRKYFLGWRDYVRKIEEIAVKELGEAEVYVFGSIVKGQAHPALSDIDVLIVSSNAPKDNVQRAKIIAKILKELGPFNPFEIHLASPTELEWYKRFVDKLLRVVQTEEAD